MRLLWLALLLAEALGDLDACSDGLIQMLNGFKNLSSDNGKMLLYSGKYVNDLGRYDPCNSIPIAKYAIVEIYRAPYIVFAFCGPAKCSASDYYELIGNLTHPAFSKLRREQAFPIDVSAAIVRFPKDYVDRHYETLSWGAVLMILVIVFLFVICALGTILDLLQRHGISRPEKLSIEEDSEDPLKKERFVAASFVEVPSNTTHRKLIQGLQCFSFYSNFIALLKVPYIEKHSHLRVLEGVRVLTLCWLILGNVADARLLRGVVMNINYLPDIIADVKLTFIPTAGYALDTMLWITGFILTYMLLVDLQELPKLNWAEVYLHRLWRMFPLVAFVLFLTWALFPYFGSGPMWFSYADFSSKCHDYWWANLLFINNFFPGGKYSSCFVISYYISLEVQYFLLTPMLLYLYRHWGPMTAWLGALFLVIIGLVTSYEVAREYNLNAQETAVDNNGYDEYYYYRPYTRVPPYAWGLLCALIVFGYDNRTYKKQDRAAVAIAKMWSKRYVAIGSFVVGIGLVTFCVFIQQTALKQGGPQFTYWSADQNYAFITFNRWLFSIGVSGIVVPMTLGALSWPSKILAADFWAPFSRLTYSCYLVSYNLCIFMTLSQNAGFYINYMTLAQNALVFIFLSYFAGFCICLLVEIPVLSLEKMLVQSRHSLLA